MEERGRSSDSGLPSPRPSQPVRPVASSRSGVSPYSGGTVPDSHRVPSPCSCVWAAAYHRGLTIRPVSAQLRLWLPVVAWAALIFALSSIPDLGTGLGTWDLVLRKIAHASEYAVLGALLLRAVGHAVPAFGLGVAYAVSDEIHQSFVEGRRGTPLDVLIDSIGVAVGVLAWRRFVARQTT
jgi:VanZ family protein